jgi:hypothetical protein
MIVKRRSRGAQQVMIASGDLQRRNEKRGKGLFPEPKTRCMWMWLTCLSSSSACSNQGKGDGEDEKRKELVGRAATRLKQAVELFRPRCKRARTKLFPSPRIGLDLQR